nr:peptide methionine sulfoxide reductase B5-like isoform X1 [Arachis hypogaea]
MQIEGYWEYNKFYEEGVYNCAGCATPLYKSSTKFDSGYGWPVFFEGLLGAINRSVDAERAYHRNALVILEKLYTELLGVDA